MSLVIHMGGKAHPISCSTHRGSALVICHDTLGCVCSEPLSLALHQIDCGEEEESKHMRYTSIRHLWNKPMTNWRAVPAISFKTLVYVLVVCHALISLWYDQVLLSECVFGLAKLSINAWINKVSILFQPSDSPEFINPLLEGADFKDGQLWVTGNRVIININLSSKLKLIFYRMF